MLTMRISKGLIFGLTTLGIPPCQAATESTKPMMKAVIIHAYGGPEVLKLEDVPRPEPTENEVLVRVIAAGVNPVDAIIREGTYAREFGTHLPLVPGYDIAGVVQKAGAKITRLKAGDAVYGYVLWGGGYAEYVKALDWIVDEGAIPVPDGVLAEEAAFVEPVNTCLKAVKRAAVQPGQSTLVVGQGTIGLLLMQLCRWAGADVLVSDTFPDRLEMARRLGASVALDATAVDIPREVRALTGGRGADLAVLAAFGQAPFGQAVDATRPGGRIIVFAATSPGETVQIDLGALSAAEKEILTSYSASVDVQDLAAQLVFAREVRVRELVTHRFTLDDAPRALEVASHPAPGVLKVVLQSPTHDGGRQTQAPHSGLTAR